MKRGCIVAAIVLEACLSCFAKADQNISYYKVRWSGASANVIAINLNSPDTKVTVSLARKGRGSSESFGSMVNRVKPTAAITGTFFCTRSLLPTGDIVIEGNSIHTGSVGTGVCVTPDNKVEFVPYSIGHRNRWQGYDTVLCAGPTLVRKGSVYLIPRDEGFRDPSLFGNKRRSAVGLTGNNKLLFVTVETPVQLRKLSKMMLHLGAVDAVALDGGSSTALHYNGKTISRPGRSLTNLLVAYSTPASYNLHREALAPGMRRTQIASADVKSAQPSMPLIGRRLLTDKQPLPTNLMFLSSDQMEQLTGDQERSLLDSQTPVTHSDRREPVVPETEAAMNTYGKTDSSLVPISLKSTRRALREQELMMSSRLFIH